MIRHFFGIKKYKISRRRMRPTGAAVIDYLMLTAAVAGVGVPVMMRFFGAPIQASLFSKRQTLVSFLAQDRKSSVPNAWFSQETVPDQQVGTLAATKDLSDPTVATPGDLSSPGNISQPNPKAPGNLSGPPDLKQAGDISVGGGGGGGGGGAGGAGGGGAGGAGNGGLGNDFFGDGKKDFGSPGEENAAGGSGSTYGRGGGKLGGSSGDDGNEADSDTGGKAKKQNGGDEQAKSGGPGESRKAMLEGMKRVEEADSAKKHAFDWYLLLKIFIVLLIILLLALIAISNLKRR